MYCQKTDPVLKRIRNNDTSYHFFAFSNGGITNSREFLNNMKIPNIFTETMKIPCNSVIECCCF